MEAVDILWHVLSGEWVIVSKEAKRAVDSKWAELKSGLIFAWPLMDPVDFSKIILLFLK